MLILRRIVILFVTSILTVYKNDVVFMYSYDFDLIFF